MKHGEKTIKTISTGEIIATIYTNHSVTIEEGIKIAGGEIINPETPWDPNVIIDDKGYWIDDLTFAD